MRGLDIPHPFNILPGTGKNQARTIPREMDSRRRFSLTSFNIFRIQVFYITFSKEDGKLA
jgi:hypothetical protein